MYTTASAVQKVREARERRMFGLKPLEEPRHVITWTVVTRAECGRRLFVTIELFGGTILGGFIPIQAQTVLMQFIHTETARCISPAFLAWLREVLESR